MLEARKGNTDLCELSQYEWRMYIKDSRAVCKPWGVL